MNSRFWTMRKGLTLSVALNVFLVFLIAAHVWRHQHYRRQDKLARFLARVPSQLPKEDGRKFEAALDPHRAELTREEAELRRARDRVVEVLRAEPFDPDVFRRAVEEARGSRATFENEFIKSFIEAAQRLSPEGRRRLSELRVNPG